MEAPSVNGAYLDRTPYPPWRVAAEAAGHVDEGVQQAAEATAVAPSDEDLGLRRNRLGECPYQQRLTRAGHPADKDEMAEAEGGLLEQVLEARDLVVTLEHSNRAR